MKLKKINEKLREGLVENGIRGQYFTERNFSALKSGADCVIISPKGSGNPQLLLSM
jgi:hypothetical protein